MTVAKPNPWRESWRRLKMNRAAVAGLAVLVTLVASAVAAPWIAPYEPAAIDMRARLQGPSVKHPLGTDNFGRDIFSRIVYAGRISLVIGFVAVGIGAVFGGIAGAVSGYYGRGLDSLVMRTMDVLLSIPQLILAIAIVGALGASLLNLMIAVGISVLPRYARLVRASAMSLRDLEFVEAARGAKKTIDLERPAVCAGCKGSGAESEADIEVCGTCHGQGQVLRQRGFLTISTSCSSCRGEGRVVRKPCKACRGRRQVREKKSVEVAVPAGVEEGNVLRLRGEGMPSPTGGPAGDLLIVLRVLEHPVFRRHGLDLLLVLRVSFVQAALGDTLAVPTLDGEEELRIPAGTQPQALLRLEGLGTKTGRQTGDLLVQVA